VRRTNVPPARAAPQELGLQATATAECFGDHDAQGVRRADRAHLDGDDALGRRTAADAAELADPVVTDAPTAAVAPQSLGTALEEHFHRREVVVHERSLVGPERPKQSVGDGSVHHWTVAVGTLNGLTFVGGTVGQLVQQ
jgi:hypothetical protein